MIKKRFSLKQQSILVIMCWGPSVLCSEGCNIIVKNTWLLASSFAILACTLGSIQNISGETKNETVVNTKTWMCFIHRFLLPCRDRQWNDWPKHLQTPVVEMEKYAVPSEWRGTFMERQPYTKAETPASDHICYFSWFSLEFIFPSAKHPVVEKSYHWTLMTLSWHDFIGALLTFFPSLSQHK